MTNAGWQGGKMKAHQGKVDEDSKNRFEEVQVI